MRLGAYIGALNSIKAIAFYCLHDFISTRAERMLDDSQATKAIAHSIPIGVRDYWDEWLAIAYTMCMECVRQQK